MSTRAARRCIALLFSFTAASAAGHDGARSELDRLERRSLLKPESLGSLLLRSALHRRLGEYDRASDALAAAESLAPDSARVRLERAELHAAQERWEDVLSETTAALNATPTRRALELRALAHERTGALAAAADDLTAAIGLSPTADVILHAARLLEQLGRRERAIATLERGLQSLNGSVAVREALVGSLLRARRFDSALAHIDAVLPSLRVAADWRLRRAEVLEKAGREAEARRERVVALSEIDALLSRRSTDLHRLTRAEALASLGRSSAARTALSEVLPSPATQPRIDRVLLRLQGVRR